MLMLVILLAGALLGHAGDSATLLDVFPASVAQVPAAQRGQTTLSTTYTPSGSLWYKGLKEEDVFNLEMKHTQNEHNSFSLRIGKGGQLYSLRGAFGESIPPQRIQSPWNDEVWQFVAVCGKYNFPVIQLKGRGPGFEDAIQRLEQSPYDNLYFIHNSGAYMPSNVDSGVITLSCDVLLDEQHPGMLDIILREALHGEHTTFASLRVSETGIMVDDAQVAPAKAGVWHTIQLVFDLDQEAKKRKKAVLTVTPADGPAARAELLLADVAFSAFTWLGLSAGGAEDGLIHVDNLSIQRETDSQTEWPLQEDFEDYTPGQQFGTVVGRDTAKGADARVTDRAAASGRHSLQLQDATLAPDWQPLVRQEITTSISRNLYCPLLASDQPAGGATYRTLNWGIIPQLKTIHRSPILYYVQTRDVGDGIIEMTYVVHNFSVREDIVFEWLNAPWGGTRFSSLPFHYVSSPEGDLKDRVSFEDSTDRAVVTDVRNTGGWNLSCATEAPDSPSLALVFGRDKHLETELEKAKQGLPHCQYSHSLYKDDVAHHVSREQLATMKENTWRNYDVAVLIPKFRLSPGTTIWYRSFLVANSKERTIELAKSLVDKVDYGLRVFAPETTPKVPLSVGTSANASVALFAHPVPGSMPLFLIENQSTGREVITTDPYIFVPQEALDFGVPPGDPLHAYYGEAVGYSLDDNNSRWKRLLGYGYVEKPASGDWVRLSSVLPPAQFPDVTRWHLDLWVMK